MLPHATAGSKGPGYALGRLRMESTTQGRGSLGSTFDRPGQQTTSDCWQQWACAATRWASDFVLAAMFIVLELHLERTQLDPFGGLVG
jgi:hypothetical protein